MAANDLCLFRRPRPVPKPRTLLTLVRFTDKLENVIIMSTTLASNHFQTA